MSEGGLKLPTEKTEPKSINPRTLLIFGKPKQGKSHLLSLLDNNLIVDVNNGSDFLSGLFVKANNIADLRKIRQLIIEAGKPYKYITLDTITDIEEMSKELALQLYRATPIGKNFGLDVEKMSYKPMDILSLPNGAGYGYVRSAFDKIIGSFKGLSEYLVLIGHTKDKNITKEGKELSENTLDLSGKLERLTIASMDAVGYLYREGNKNYLNFQGGGDSIVEARPKHLRNQNILLGESDDDGNLTAYWDKIFI